MPFTFCHPAIILPVKSAAGRRLSLTGLAVGSMAPDFEYFIRMKLAGQTGHSFWGIFYFDLPVAFLVATVFHLVVRNRLFEQLPEDLRARLSAFTHFDWKEYVTRHTLWVVASILIGICSHLFWDAFTHQTGFFVAQIELLSREVTISRHTIPLYNLLQHASSLVGAMVLWIWFMRLPKTRVTPLPLDRVYWLALGSVTALVFATRFAWGLSISDVGNVVVTAISASALGILAASLLQKPAS